MDDYIDSVFGPDGVLAHRFEGYVPQQGQIELAQAVDDAIRDGGHVMAEAPTGTGKSIGYSVPATHHAAHGGRRVVIATANIALQDQLVDKDLPLLADILPWDFTFALIKSRNNYLCHDRLYQEEAQGTLELLDDPADAKMLQALVAWARQTATGDVSELPFEPPHRLWRRFSTSSEDCKGSDCRFRDDCCALKARTAAQEADALGRSLLRREQMSVRSRLGARSACTAEVRVTGGPQVVAGWLGVCRKVGRCSAGATMTAAEAHELVGQTCALSANDTDGSRGCEGDGPWESTYAHDPGASQRSFIASVGGDRFFVHSVRIESAPLRCRGPSTVSFDASSVSVTVTTADERLRVAPGRVLPQESADEGTCLVLPAATATEVFELATAKALGGVPVVDHHGVTVALDAPRSRLALDGGGCDGAFVPLDGSARLLGE